MPQDVDCDGTDATANAPIGIGRAANRRRRGNSSRGDLQSFKGSQRNEEGEQLALRRHLVLPAVVMILMGRYPAGRSSVSLVVSFVWRVE